jgi:hypothetical protein
MYLLLKYATVPTELLQKVFIVVQICHLKTIIYLLPEPECSLLREKSQTFLSLFKFYFNHSGNKMA